MSEQIVWENREHRELAERVLKLRDSEIGALFGLLLDFRRDDIQSAVAEVREQGLLSGHLPILVEEADLNELTWWVDYFESE